MLVEMVEIHTELMDEIQLSAVQEAMNQMMGSAATSCQLFLVKK